MKNIHGDTRQDSYRLITHVTSSITASFDKIKKNILHNDRTVFNLLVLAVEIKLILKQTHARHGGRESGEKSRSSSSSVPHSDLPCRVCSHTSQHRADPAQSRCAPPSKRSSRPCFRPYLSDSHWDSSSKSPLPTGCSLLLQPR